MFSANASSNVYENMVEVCVASAMHQIKNMTSEQLNELIYSDAKLEAVIDGLPQVRSLPTERESDLAQNKSLAEWNLAQQPRLETLKAQVKSNHERASTLKDEVNALKNRIGSLSSDRSLEVTCSLLQVAAQEVDDEAEGLSRNFANGDVDYLAFRDNFLKKKAQAHVRKVKSEKLQRVMQEQEYSRASPAVGNHRPISMPVPGNAPYPDLKRHNFW